MRPRLARLTHPRPGQCRAASRASREVDLSEDRRCQAEGIQRLGRRQVLQQPRPGAQQAIHGDDQEHAPPLHPPSAGARSHRQKRGRTRRPARRPARTPVPRHDRGAGCQGPRRGQGKPRPPTSKSSRSARLRPQPLTRPARPASSHAGPNRARTRPSRRSATISADTTLPLVPAPARPRRRRRSRTAGSKRCSSWPSPSACALASCARSPGTMSTSTRRHSRLALCQAGRRHQDTQVQALARAAQARHRRAHRPPDPPGRRTASGRRRVAGQQPRLLPRRRDQYTRDALNWRFSKMTSAPASATGTPTKDGTPPYRS